MLSIIIISYNDSFWVKKLVKHLVTIDAKSEIILVESGSTKYFKELPKRITSFKGKKGRSKQLNFGASKAKGDVFLFLHADCLPTKKALQQLQTLSNNIDGGCLTQTYILPFVKDKKLGKEYLKKQWGFSFPYPFWSYLYTGLSRIFELRIHFRSHIQKNAYGDQGIFVRKEMFKKLQGFKDMKLFEDREFTERLAKRGHWSVLSGKIYTYPRKHLKEGLLNYSKFCLQMTKKYQKGAFETY